MTLPVFVNSISTYCMSGNILKSLNFYHDGYLPEGQNYQHYDVSCSKTYLKATVPREHDPTEVYSKIPLTTTIISMPYRDILIDTNEPI